MARLPGMIFVLFLCAIPAATANDAPVKSVGKAIQPLADAPVRMAAEKVSIFIESNVARVNCVFTLVNEGKPDTIEVGFPRGWEDDLIGFIAANDDTRETYPVETLAQDPSYGEFNGEKLPWWKVFRVPFDSTGRTIKVRNTYRSLLRPTGGEYPFQMNDLQFTYIMKTGVAWKGTIGEAEMSISLGDIPMGRITKVTPEGYIREGTRLIWHFRDIEPSENIVISLMNEALYERAAIADKLLAGNPSNAYAHFLLGTVYYNRRYCEKDMMEKAEGEFLMAVSLDPKLWDARWYLGALYAHQAYGDNEKKKRADANAQFEAILKGKPDYTCADSAFHIDDMVWTREPAVWLKTR